MNKTERPTRPRSAPAARSLRFQNAERGEGRGEKLSLYPLKLVHFLRNETGGGKGREERETGWLVAG